MFQKNKNTSQTLNEKPKVRIGYWVVLTTSLLIAIIFLIPLPEPVPATTQIPAASIVNGVAATWPCTPPITWKFNSTIAPKGALEDTQKAFDEYAKNTGLIFQYKGETDEIPQNSDLENPKHSEKRTANIIVAYAYSPGDGTPESTLLDGQDTGAAKTATATVSRKRLGLISQPTNTLTAADIVIKPLNKKIVGKKTYGGKSNTYAFILHEVGHAIGLDHANVTQISIMTPALDGTIDTLSTADKTSLRTLYASCLTK